MPERELFVSFGDSDYGHSVRFRLVEIDEIESKGIDSGMFEKDGGARFDLDRLVHTGQPDLKGIVDDIDPL
jgi:hypothetical protein